MPICSDYYQEAFFRSQGLNYQKEIANLNPEQNPDEGGGAVQLFNILQFIGLYLTISLIMTQGNYFQIGIIVVVFLAYYLIERHVKNQEGRRRQRNNEANANPVPPKQKMDQEIQVELEDGQSEEARPNEEGPREEQSNRQ